MMSISALLSTRPGASGYSKSELQAEIQQVPDELIVGIDSSGDSPQTEDLPGLVVESFHFEDEGLSDAKEIVRIRLPEGKNVAQAMAELKGRPGIAYAEPNQIIRLKDDKAEEFQLSSTEEPGEPREPNDLHPELWGLHNRENSAADISAPGAWKKTTGSANSPLIAVLDSGADYEHPDLKANIAVNEGEIPGDGIDNDGNGVIDDVYGYNAFEDTGDPMDGMGHGTHCTGTIAAVGNNGQGIVGVNWQARVLPIKIFHDRGVTTTDSILRGLQYAQKRGARITSNSWGGSQFSQAIYDAFLSVDALHVAAAGNEGENNDVKGSYPANYEMANMISVGASNSQDEPSWFSNTGRESVDLFAPGEDILSTLPGGEFGKKSGTSMAAPHVTGVLGLVADAYPDMSNQELRDRVLYATDPLATVADISISGGRLNAARALSDDALAPAAPNDFWVTESSPRRVRFSWTGTGDDGWKNGPATAFEVRVSAGPITSENWDEAEVLPTPRGHHIGDHHHAIYQQSPRSEETILYAGFKALDEAGNRSPLVTTEARLPAASLAYGDDFDAVESQWDGQSRWKRVQEEGRGLVWSSQSGPTSPTFSELYSPNIDLSEAKSSFLKFDSRQDFSWSNNVFLDISTDGGESWSRVDDLKDRGAWKTHEYDLSAFDGEIVKLRFRSENLGSKEGDGMKLDNLEILKG